MGVTWLSRWLTRMVSPGCGFAICRMTQCSRWTEPRARLYRYGLPTVSSLGFSDRMESSEKYPQPVVSRKRSAKRGPSLGQVGGAMEQSCTRPAQKDCSRSMQPADL